jgi:hypothetical protein
MLMGDAQNYAESDLGPNFIGTLVPNSPLPPKGSNTHQPYQDNRDVAGQRTHRLPQTPVSPMPDTQLLHAGECTEPDTTHSR